MIRRLLFLNGLSAMAIPLHHAAAYSLQAMFQWTDRYREVATPNYDQLWTSSFYFLMFIRQLMTFAVPAFLFVSGFYIAFMARSRESEVTLKSLVPRMKILLIPFLIWTAFRFLLLQRVPTSIEEILEPYNYIPLLFQFYLLSPWLVVIAKKNWRALIAVTCVVQLSFVFFRYLTLFEIYPSVFTAAFEIPTWVFVWQPLWFALGLVGGLHLDGLKKKLNQWRWILLTGAALFAAMTMVEYRLVTEATNNSWLGPTFGGISRPIYCLLFILTILAFDVLFFRGANKVSRISAHSLGIYMVNIPAIYLVAYYMYFQTPFLLELELLYLLILFAAGLGGPLMLMLIIRKSRARWAYRYLFG